MENNAPSNESVAKPYYTSIDRKAARCYAKNVFISFIGAILGVIIGFLLYGVQPSVYKARASFLVDEIPFVQASMLNSDDERQFVHTMILSIATRKLANVVADTLKSDPKNLAFASIDRRLSLWGSSPQANINIIPIRESRIGEIIVLSQSSDFALKVTNEIFNQIQLINRMGGELKWLTLRVRLLEEETKDLTAQFVKLSGDFTRLSQQNAELAEYVQRELPLTSFPAFSDDITLNNLKTQLILIQSEYNNIAYTSVGSSRLEGKRAELESLKSQIAKHTNALAGALRTQHAIVENQYKETGLKISRNEEQLAALRDAKARLAESYGDPKAMKDILARQTGAEPRLESCMVPVQYPTIGTRPEYPKLWLNMLLGGMLGGSLALGINFFIRCIRFLRSEEN